MPAVVHEVVGRSEFLTAYAGEPYEDHGRFQALYEIEYQPLMAELLEMDVVNVPTYDGFQATATALAMAHRITRRRRLVVASDLGPDLRSKVDDLVCPYLDLEDDVAAVWLQTPSFTGAVETAVRELADAAHAVGALLVVGTDPICLRGPRAASP